MDRHRIGAEVVWVDVGWARSIAAAAAAAATLWLATEQRAPTRLHWTL